MREHPRVMAGTSTEVPGVEDDNPPEDEPLHITAVLLEVVDELERQLDAEEKAS